MQCWAELTNENVKVNQRDAQTLKFLPIEPLGVTTLFEDWEQEKKFQTISVEKDIVDPCKIDSSMTQWKTAILLSDLLSEKWNS